MYRQFVSATRRFLSLRPISIAPTSSASRTTSIYDVRRDCPSECHRVRAQPTGRHLLQDGLQKTNTRWASGFQMSNPSEILCNFVKMSKCIDMSYLKDTPPPVFWVVSSAAAFQLIIPILEVIGGYCSVLTYMQLYMAAMTLAFDGGKKWGLAVSSNPKPEPSWDTMNRSLIPPGFALTGLILPYPLGFLTMITGLLVSLYLDLQACIYSPGLMAASYLLNLSTVIGLIMALTAYVLFHNRENARKKMEALSEEEEGLNEDEGGDDKK